MAAAVERLLSAVAARIGIDRLGRVVGVDAGLCAGGAQQPVAVKESAVAGRRADPPAIDLLADFARRFVDFGKAVLDA